jgi:hypothetical protein
MLTLVERCPWYVAGPLLGLLIVAFRALLNRPLGALGGFIEVYERGLAPGRWTINVFVLLGIVAGGALFAWLGGSAAAPPPPALAVPFLPAATWLQTAALVAAGVLMGFGARAAGGCTSGHGLTGNSLLSPASAVATATFMGTAVVLANLAAWLTGISS